MTAALTCVSLFSGAGGLDAGLSAAGFDVLASVEADGDCCATLKANGAQRVIESPVELVEPGQLLTELGLEPGKLDLLAGGPPCQPFSKSAFWASKAAQGLLDGRARTLDRYFDFAQAFQPRTMLIENVEGFVSGGGLAYVEMRLKEFSEDGLQYSLRWRVVDAACYGVAQHRRRFIGVMCRDNARFAFPKPTHGRRHRPYLSAWDACRAADRFPSAPREETAIKGRWADLVPSIPEGRNYLWHTDRGGGEPLFGWRTRYWSFLLKLEKQRPAPTIVANPSQNSGPFHWDNRLLTTAELAAIQGFGPNYSFVGDRPSRQRQIGNAVPPPLAELLGRAIARQLGAAVPRCRKLVTKRAGVPPPPKQPGTVPEHYRPLRGKHRAHPGTGKGPRPRPAPIEGSAIEAAQR